MQNKPPPALHSRHENKKNLKSSERLRKQKRALLALAKARFSQSRNLEASFRKITEVAGRCLEISRAGIWLLSPDGKMLRCHTVFDGSRGRFSSKDELEVSHQPNYFKALAQQRTIVANDVLKKPQLEEFWNDQVLRHKTLSSIDAAIRSNGKLVGVIRLEEKRVRKWMSDEEQFAGSLADIAALALKEDELRKIDFLNKNLAELGQKLNACTTPQMAVRLIGQTAQKIWGWDALYLHLYDEVSDHLMPVLNFDTIDGRKVSVSLDKLSVTRAKKILKHKKLLLNRDSTSEIQLLPFGDVTRVSESRMFTTIRKKGRVLALLSIQSYSPNAYDSRALDGLEALGEYCTGAVARIQAEISRREGEERFQSLAEATTEGILIHSTESIFEVNSELSRMFEYTGEQLKTKSLADLLVGFGTRPKRKKRDSSSWEGMGIRKNGTHFPIHVVTRSCHYLGKPAEVTAIRDISERKKLEHRLRDHSRQILEAQENERRRVSRDLHDSVNQVLTAAQFSLQNLKRSLDPSNSRSHAHLASTQEIIAKAMEEIRIISWDLRPNELDNFGLPIAIGILCRDSEERTGIAISFSFPDLPLHLDQDSAVTLFRIIQEGLSNACRHSGATRIEIKVQWSQSTLMVDILDNGIGFSPHEVKPVEGKKSGLGIPNMRERAASAGGFLELRASPGKGTRLRLNLPLLSFLPPAERPSRKLKPQRDQESITNQKKRGPAQNRSKR